MNTLDRFNTLDRYKAHKEKTCLKDLHQKAFCRVENISKHKYDFRTSSYIADMEIARITCNDIWFNETIKIIEFVTYKLKKIIDVDISMHIADYLLDPQFLYDFLVENCNFIYDRERKRYTLALSVNNSRFLINYDANYLREAEIKTLIGDIASEYANTHKGCDRREALYFTVYFLYHGKYQELLNPQPTCVPTDEECRFDLMPVEFKPEISADAFIYNTTDVYFKREFSDIAELYDSSVENSYDFIRM